MHVRNIPSNFVKYSKRVILWRTNSSPYLSGDVFADFADISFYPPFLRGSRFAFNEISRAEVVFCPSHHLERLLIEFGEYLSPKVLILGNSDRDITVPFSNIPDSVKVIFCQNLLMRHPLYLPLPIGVENRRLGTNGLFNLINDEYSRKPKYDKILLGPFKNTHSERDEINLRNYSSGLIEIADRRISPSRYAEEASNYKYVASPRGNGQDTHRFWETLYRGGIPLVKSSLWTSQISELGIPVIEVSDWSEEELIRARESSNHSFGGVRETPQLWWPWWKSKIESYVSN